MFFVTSVNRMTISTIVSTRFSIIFISSIILSKKIDFMKTHILSVAIFSTKDTNTKNTISIGINTINIGHREVVSQLTLLLSHQRKNLGNGWYRFH